MCRKADKYYTHACYRGTAQLHPAKQSQLRQSTRVNYLVHVNPSFKDADDSFKVPLPGWPILYKEVAIGKLQLVGQLNPIDQKQHERMCG